MIKAVLFDMDGVLYDSMPWHVQSWKETMAEFGVVEPIESFYLFEGRTGSSTISLLFNKHLGREASPDEIKELYARKSRRFIELENNQSKPMPGALEVLEKVKERGLKSIIVTGSGQVSLFEKLDKNFPGFFRKDQMVTAYDVKMGKPHPEPYLMGLQKGNILPNEAIVVENAPLGIMSARAANIYTVAVNTGPLPDSVLLEAGANILFPSMTALAQNISNLL